jgi:uncharacterized protein (DUF3084 family)
MVMTATPVVRSELSLEQKMDFRVDADLRRCRADVLEIAQLIIDVKNLESTEAHILYSLKGIDEAEQQLQTLKEQETAAEQRWFLNRKLAIWNIRKEREAVNTELGQLRTAAADADKLVKIREEIRALNQKIDKLSYELQKMLRDIRYCEVFEQKHLTQIEDQVNKEMQQVSTREHYNKVWSGEVKSRPFAPPNI